MQAQPLTTEQEVVPRHFFVVYCMVGVSVFWYNCKLFGLKVWIPHQNVSLCWSVRSCRLFKVWTPHQNVSLCWSVGSHRHLKVCQDMDVSKENHPSGFQNRLPVVFKNLTLDDVKRYYGLKISWVENFMTCR